MKTCDSGRDVQGHVTSSLTLFWMDAGWDWLQTTQKCQFVAKRLVPPSSSQWGPTGQGWTRNTANDLHTIQRKRSVSAPTHPTTHPQTSSAGPNLSHPDKEMLCSQHSRPRNIRQTASTDTEVGKMKRAILALTMHSCHKSSCLLKVGAMKEQKKPPVMRIKGQVGGESGSSLPFNTCRRVSLYTGVTHSVVGRRGGCVWFRVGWLVGWCHTGHKSTRLWFVTGWAVEDFPCG